MKNSCMEQSAKAEEHEILKKRSNGWFPQVCLIVCITLPGWNILFLLLTDWIRFKLFVFDTGILKQMAGIDNSAILLKSKLSI